MFGACGPYCHVIHSKMLALAHKVPQFNSQSTQKNVHNEGEGRPRLLPNVAPSPSLMGRLDSTGCGNSAIAMEGWRPGIF